MSTERLLATSDDPPGRYDRPAQYSVVSERNVMVATRDGVRLGVDVYRPNAPGKFPALLAFGVHNKEIQGPDYYSGLSQPAWSSLWTGHMESGDTRFFVSRGYAHVIGSPRGFGNSEDGGSREWDGYDLIEWVARQPWCDGQVGMVGIGAFGAEQILAAKQQPPHLKAIFPYDPRGAYGLPGGFRDEYPGGVLHFFRYLLDHSSAAHRPHDVPQLSPEKEALWRAACSDPDFRMYPHLYNVIAQKGHHMPQLFDMLTRGWLKASHRALDPERSTPWKPWHPLTREARVPVRPGEINEYAIEILSTANLFRKNHRIRLEISCLDLPTGVAGATNAEYVPYHVASSRTTLHKVYHDAMRPSHLLLPIIPAHKEN